MTGTFSWILSLTLSKNRFHLIFWSDIQEAFDDLDMDDGGEEEDDGDFDVEDGDDDIRWGLTRSTNQIDALVIQSESERQIETLY